MQVATRRQLWLFAAILTTGSSLAHASIVFYDNYPSAASLSNPQLTLSGTTDELQWATGIADGIDGPYDGGGVIYSYDRNAAIDSSPYAYMTYAITAPAGYVFSAPSASITGVTFGPSFAMILSSSYNGVTWENSVNCSTPDYSSTATATTNEAGNSNYNNLATLYYQISMPTFNLGTTGGDTQMAILDNITIQATVTSVPEPTVVGILAVGTAVLAIRRRRTMVSA